MDNGIIGWVDAIGYLRCNDCMESAPPLARSGARTSVYRDSAPHAFEACDSCGRVVNDATREATPCNTCKGTGEYKSGLHLIACPECYGTGDSE